MHLFETIIGLLVGAALLSVLARRVGIPYPTLLALGGVCIALLPIHDLPQLTLPPELILTLFAAPVLLNAAHETSLRDLRNNWRPISSLVLVAVGLTTLAVAGIVRYLVPDLPWAPAIALGALVAPPDAVAAMAVLSQLNPPHRIRTVLEGESLLNDASSLLIYKLAVGAVIAGSFHATDVLPPFFLVVFGSVIVGWFLARLARYQISLVKDTPTAVIFQFALTFGVWILAEHLGLSGVVTIVVFGLTISRYSMLSMPARLRISSFTIWDSALFILNVLAFTLIGLQVRPIFEKLHDTETVNFIVLALIILAVVIAIRLVWVMVHTFLHKISKPNFGNEQSPYAVKYGLVVSWSGMRGIVTLAAAMALPEAFPYRDFIVLTAFVVVLGTLLVQGATLGPLLKLLRFPEDKTIEREVNLTRATALQAAMSELKDDGSDAARRLMSEYNAALSLTCNAEDPHNTKDNILRRKVVTTARKAIFDRLVKNDIGDEAYRQVEEELDWLELSASSQE
jgi:Na+/H+ antiporter